VKGTDKEMTGTRDEKGDLIVPINIQPWENEYLEEEPEISGVDSLVELRKKHPSGKTARMLGAAQARGDLPERLTKMDVLLYQTGIEVDVASQITARMRTVRLENGREIHVRSLVGSPPGDYESEDPDEDSTEFDAETSTDGDGYGGDDNLGLMVDMMSEDAQNRALRFLTRNVPGYVMGRLKIIAANRGDVRAAAQELIGRIWQMVEELE